MAEEDLWAGISGIPLCREFLSEKHAITLNSRISVQCRIPDSEPKADFGNLKRLLNSKELKFPFPDSIPHLIVDHVLKTDKKAEASRASVKGILLFRDKSGRIIEAGYMVKFESDRNHNARSTVEITATGLTACPCSMGKIREMLEERYPSYSDSISTLPGITHNQRVHVTVRVEYSGYPGTVSEQMLEIVESATGNLVTHHGGEDTEKMLLDAHAHPVMVEDVARKASKLLNATFSSSDGILYAVVRCESEESIHSYNAISEQKVIF